MISIDQLSVEFSARPLFTDITYVVNDRDRIALVGKNGAGKSTMLKLLCRVTAPTEGEIDIYGRIASMLEVGTGFNGEMTGRENIYMNGAILGMTKAEIDKKFDDIVAFAEMEKFIEMCFDPGSPMNERLKESLLQMMKEGAE